MSVFPGVAAGAMWAVSLGRWRMVRSSDTRVAWVAMFSLAIAQLLQIEAVYRAFDTATGVVGAAALIKHGLALLSAACVATAGIEALAPVADAVDQRRRRFTWVTLAIAEVASVAPWILARPRALAPALASRCEYFDPTWRSAVHWAAYLGYLGSALATSAHACWRFRAATAPSSSRTALSFVGLGTTISLSYIVEKVVIVVLWLHGHGPGTVRVDQVADVVIVLVSLTLIALGCAYEPLAAAAAEARRQRDYRHAIDQLTPFADRVRREFPHTQMMLAEAPDEKVIAATAAIHESLRQLTAYVPFPDPMPPGDHVERQAWWLRQALAAKGEGVPPTFAVTATPINDAGRSLDSARALATIYALAQRSDPLHTTPVATG